MNGLVAFDADVLIYAGEAGHPLGSQVLALFRASDADTIGVGSVLLLTEILPKPLRVDAASADVAALSSLLSRLDLRPFDTPTAHVSVHLAATYGLRAADAVHLATALAAGAETFLTHNRRDFPKSIDAIDIVYTDELPPAPAGDDKT